MNGTRCSKAMFFSSSHVRVPYSPRTQTAGPTHLGSTARARGTEFYMVHQSEKYLADANLLLTFA